jgi:molybdopterin synthase catalytic subunit
VTLLATQLAIVTKLPLDIAAHQRFVSSPEAGARVLFLGAVRDNDAGREVVELEYEAHPSAEDVLRRIVAEFGVSPDVVALAVSHRSGRLAVGDLALVAAVAARHRREAFDICAELVDEVKRRLPIWKRQVFADGTDEWVNCP